MFPQGDLADFYVAGTERVLLLWFFDTSFPGSLGTSGHLGPSALSRCWPLDHKLSSTWRVLVLLAALAAVLCWLFLAPPASIRTTRGRRDLTKIQLVKSGQHGNLRLWLDNGRSSDTESMKQEPSQSEEESSRGFLGDCGKEWEDRGVLWVGCQMWRARGEQRRLKARCCMLATK